MTKIRKKWQSHKILVEKIFLVGIDLEWSETYFKTKISKLKIFAHYNFFLGLSHFFISVDSSSKIWKNWSSGTKKSKLQRIWRGSFLCTWHWIWKKNFLSLSNPTLRKVFIFHLCGQFIEYWKSWSSRTKRIKIVENRTGIISIYLTLNWKRFTFSANT